MSDRQTTDWHFNEVLGCEAYLVGAAIVTLEPRPHYCDRGHWIGKVFNVADVDSADGFPRYYMNKERAMREMSEWLHWRLNVPKRSTSEGRERCEDSDKASTTKC